MNLIKVRDNKNRPINNLDIMMRVLFGDTVPTEFFINRHYSYGDLVYTIEEDGNLQVWTCNLSGKFKRCKEPNFTKWDLNYLIDNGKKTVGDVISTKLFDTTSVLLPGTYDETDEMAYFTAVADTFDISNYLGHDDYLEVFLRRDFSDHYITKEEYELVDNSIRVGIPIQDMINETTNKSEFLPIGKEIEEGEDAPYWYVERGVKRTCMDPISLDQFDLLDKYNQSVEYGYKLYDLKITSVRTVVTSDRGTSRMDVIEIKDHDPLGSELGSDIQSIEIPIVVGVDRVSDVLQVTFNPVTQLLDIHSKSGHVYQVTFSYTSKKDSPIDLFIVGNKAASTMTRLIQVTDQFGTVITQEDGHHLVEVPINDLLQYNSYDFEVYMNRVYVNNYEQVLDTDTGKLYLSFTDEKYMNWDTDVFLFHIFYSVSQGAAVIRTSDNQAVTMDKEAFRIHLTTSYIDKYQWLRMRDGAKIIPPENVVGGKGIASIIGEEHYLTIGHTIRADVFSMIFEDIERRKGSETTTCNAEVYPLLRDTHELSIPYVDYDPPKDDIILFKSGGVLVSSAKYYQDQNKFRFYNHEDGLKSGDYLEFKLLDRDTTVRVVNTYLTLSEDSQTTIETGIDLEKVAFHLLFTMDGEYISDAKYTIDGSTIQFKEDSDQPLDLLKDDRFELVTGHYTKNITKTMFLPVRFEVTKDNQTEFSLEGELDYNPKSDSMLLFRKDGAYIGERFYSVDIENNVLQLSNGLPDGSYLDVLLIRNLIGYTSSIQEDETDGE